MAKIFGVSFKGPFTLSDSIHRQVICRVQEYRFYFSPIEICSIRQIIQQKLELFKSWSLHYKTTAYFKMINSLMVMLGWFLFDFGNSGNLDKELSIVCDACCDQEAIWTVSFSLNKPFGFFTVSLQLKFINIKAATATNADWLMTMWRKRKTKNRLITTSL